MGGSAPGGTPQAPAAPSEPAALRAAVLAALDALAPGTDLARVRPDRPLREQVDLDSLDWLGLIAGLEARLGRPMPAAGGAGPMTLDSLVASLAAQPPAPAAVPASVAAEDSRVIDGRAVRMRPLRAEDAGLEAEFVRRLSAQSRYQRFMVALRELPPRKLAELTQVDQCRHVALAATVQEDEGREVLVGVARYVVDAGGAACEFAIVLADAWQHSGLAGWLLRALVDTARRRGLQSMEGIVLASNRHMLRLARQLGFERRPDPQDRSLVQVALQLRPDARAAGFEGA